MDKFEVMIKVGSLGAWGDLGGYNCKECQCQNVVELLTWTTDNWQTALDQSKRKEESFIVFCQGCPRFLLGCYIAYSGIQKFLVDLQRDTSTVQ